MSNRDARVRVSMDVEASDQQPNLDLIAFSLSVSLALSRLLCRLRCLATWFAVQPRSLLFACKRWEDEEDA